MIPIGLASDHAGYQLKQFVKQYLEERHIEYKDYGTYNEESCDYPDYAHALADGVGNKELNKHQHIRAALVWMPEIARMTRMHNDANVLVMPGRYIDNMTASSIMDEFLQTQFESGRHIRRIEKIPVVIKK